MRLVEKHIINKNSALYAECDGVCFKSKNLYNYANYIIRQEFIQTSKEKQEGARSFTNYLNYNQINRILVDEKQFDMYQLPLKVSNQTLMVLDKNWKSFFASIRDYKKNPSKYNGKPKLPSYLDKENGRFIAIYEKGAISQRFLKKGILALSKTNIQLTTKKENILMVRIVPRLDHYVIEIVYQIPDVSKLENNNRYLSLDLGVNNLATITSNVKDIKPVIINGKPLKSINQFYNKRVSNLKSKLKDGKKTSRRIKSLTDKRNNKIKDYLHKASTLLVNQLVSNDLNTLIIGNNKGWKQDINIGKRNNQNFVQIPHSTFIKMLEYKCKLRGINVLITEESYTSKCSFLDNEDIKKQKEYKGSRIKRGLFKSSKGILINADVNGSLNILKKVVGNFKYNPIEVCSTPAVITVKFN